MWRVSYRKFILRMLYKGLGRRNLFLFVTKLSKLNIEKTAKTISTFDFQLGFSKILIQWTSKGSGRRYFTRQTLVDIVSLFITKSYLTIGT